MLRRMRKKWHNDIEFMNKRNGMQINNIYSWIQNEVMKEQGIEFDNFEMFQYIKNLHKSLKLYDFAEQDRHALIRGGKNNDGGYIMWNGMSEIKIAYSIGIHTDVSWDLFMVGYGYEVFQYDHTIEKLPCENKKFHFNKIGLTGETETNELKQLKTLLSNNQHHNGGMILKMDIEGYEWGVLRNAENELTLFDQIIVELHNLIDTRNHSLVIEALENISKTHAVVHIHANNFETVNYCGKYITPNTIEATFVKKDLMKLIESNKTLPLLIDQPCNPLQPEIWIGRWN